MVTEGTRMHYGLKKCFKLPCSALEKVHLKIAKPCHILLNSYFEAKCGIKRIGSSEIRALQKKLLGDGLQFADSLNLILQ